MKYISLESGVRILNFQSHGYCFVIVDVETNEDIFCFRPEMDIGTSGECDTFNETELPDSCEVSILDSTPNKAIQREILELIHPILHSSLESDDQIVLLRVCSLLLSMML